MAAMLAQLGDITYIIVAKSSPVKECPEFSTAFFVPGSGSFYIARMVFAYRPWTTEKTDFTRCTLVSSAYNMLGDANSAATHIPLLTAFAKQQKDQFGFGSVYVVNNVIFTDMLMALTATDMELLEKLKLKGVPLIKPATVDGYATEETPAPTPKRRLLI